MPSKDFVKKLYSSIPLTNTTKYLVAGPALKELPNLYKWKPLLAQDRMIMHYLTTINYISFGNTSLSI